MKRLDNGKMLFEFGDTNEDMYASRIINATGGADRLSLSEIDEVRHLVVEAMNIAIGFQTLPKPDETQSYEDTKLYWMGGKPWEGNPNQVDGEQQLNENEEVVKSK